MKFLVTKTSDYRGLNRPCEGAKLESFTHIDRIYSKYTGDKWFKEGKNHSVDGEYTIREVDVQKWFIEVQSFEDLITLQEKYGRIIIDKDPVLSIEIYDDWRE